MKRDDIIYARVWATLLEAGAAFQVGDRKSASTHLRATIEHAEGGGMPLCGACARLRLAELVGDDEAEKISAPAQAWMKEQGIIEPDRVLAVVAPGFGGTN